MKKKTFKMICNIAVSIFLPFLAGCQPVGLASGLESLFGGAGGGPTDIGLLSLLDGGGSDGGVGLAAIHNPEPTSMLLIGGGMAAMAYLRKKNTRKM